MQKGKTASDSQLWRRGIHPSKKDRGRLRHKKINTKRQRRSTPSTSSLHSLKTVLENLEHDANKLVHWFKINYMKANPEKFQFMILSKKWYQSQKRFANTFTIGESDEV